MLSNVMSWLISHLISMVTLSHKFDKILKRKVLPFIVKYLDIPNYHDIYGGAHFIHTMWFV